MANLKDLIVNGVARIIGKTYSSEFVGNLTGNADTATKVNSSLSIKDAAGNSAITSWDGDTSETLAIGGTSPITATAANGEITISHNNSTVSAGTYKSVTVDAKGHVTGGTNPSTLNGYGITDAKIANGVITLGSNTITPLTSSSTLAASKVSGTLATSNIPNLDAAKITSGTIDVERLPATALERCVVVANDTARFALKTSSVQVGDTVKVTATKKMYMVVDSDNLSTEAGYEEYFTSTDWSTITNKPSSYTPSSHTHSDATTSASGFMSSTDKAKLDGITESADSVSFTRSLTSGTKVGTITINGTGTDLYAPTNTDTHYTAKNVVASSSTGAANVTAETSNPYLNLIEDGAVRSTHRISGSGATSVKTDTSGNITISSTNTTYEVATTSSNGLMSSADKTTLDNVASTYATKEEVSAELAKKVDTSSVQNGGGTASWGASVTVGAVAGTNLTFTMPSNPNTDTKNTAGSTNTTSKIYLIGATSQGDNPVTYSNSSVYTQSGQLYASKVWNAVFNDLADAIPVGEGDVLEAGYCYGFDGEHYTKTSEYMQKSYIGIHSDTFGFLMGHEEGKEKLNVAVAGFVLAYVDREYEVGTPLTCTENGYLTEIKKENKIEYPERIVATYWKSEPNEEWGPEDKKVRVNGRRWVKVR